MAFKDSVFRACVNTKEWARHTVVRISRTAVISVASMIPVLAMGNITIPNIGIATLCAMTATLILCTGGIPEVPACENQREGTDTKGSLSDGDGLAGMDIDGFIDNATALIGSVTTLVKTLKSQGIATDGEEMDSEDDEDDDDENEDDEDDEIEEDEA